MTLDSPTLAALLPEDLHLAEPDCADALTVFPLLGRPGALEFRSFAEAAAQGCTVQELTPASVNDLMVVNPLDVPVLLFEGEEVRGARQDRTFDVTVLVPPGARQQVAVSCVEAGRWDPKRHGEAFSPSPQTAFPALRAAKNRQMRDTLADGGDARADQHEVWQALGARAQAADAPSDTGAMGDLYAARADRLGGLEAAFSRRDGQLGALVCVDDRPVVLDYVSRPDVFAALWPPLLRGYCLDALEHATAGAGRDPAAWVEEILAARPHARPASGLGSALTFTTRAVGGAGLAVDGALVQLSAFPADARGVERGSRILRPSRRR